MKNLVHSHCSDVFFFKCFFFKFFFFKCFCLVNEKPCSRPLLWCFFLQMFFLQMFFSSNVFFFKCFVSLMKSLVHGHCSCSHLRRDVRVTFKLGGWGCPLFMPFTWKQIKFWDFAKISGEKQINRSSVLVIQCCRGIIFHHLICIVLLSSCGPNLIWRVWICLAARSKQLEMQIFFFVRDEIYFVPRS